MKEIIAIIRPEKWQATMEAMEALKVHETARVRVLGRGRQRGLRYLRRPTKEEFEGIEFLPKRMVTWLVPDETVEELVAVVIRVNQTGNFGDGKIFICPLESVLDAEGSEAAAAP